MNDENVLIIGLSMYINVPLIVLIVGEWRKR